MRILSISLLAATVLLAACNGGDKDKLDANQIAEASGDVEPGTRDTRCAAAASHEAVKRELFRRAAEIRGSNAREYEQVAGFALLLIDGAAPVDAVSEREEVNCRGRATLRLPPGLMVAGGRTKLAADLAFSVAPGGVLTLGEAEAIVVPLATLTKARAVAAPAAPPPASAVDPLAPVPEPASSPPIASSNPSFNCARAHTRGEIAVCANPELAALDRAMAAQYNAVLASASPQTAALLRGTRDAFLGYRDRCGNDACIATTYRGRMREISDIATGRWQSR